MIELVYIFLFGISIGSFLNVLIDRLPNGESVLVGRSHCDYCKKTLRWYELIPLFSYILQGARCLRCHKKLSFQYPLIETFTGFGFVLIWYMNMRGEIWGIWEIGVVGLNFIIFSCFLVIFVSDLKYQIIPDSMVISGSVAVFLQLFILHTSYFILQNIMSAFGASAFFYILWLVTRGRGMGFGDVKLSFLMGLLLGFPNIVIALYVAFLTGASVGVILMIVGKKKLKSRIAFGPFLVFGVLMALVFSNQILTWWKGIL